MSVTFVYCGQTVGWIKIKLGVKVGLGPGHIVLDGVMHDGMLCDLIQGQIQGHDCLKATQEESTVSPARD